MLSIESQLNGFQSVDLPTAIEDLRSTKYSKPKSNLELDLNRIGVGSRLYVRVGYDRSNQSHYITVSMLRLH